MDSIPCIGSEKNKAGRGQKGQGLSEILTEVSSMREFLLMRVYGQDNAVNTFADGYYMSRLNSMKSRKTPAASFLFAGPPGVGKTLLAQSFAEFTGRPFMRFNMSEFSEKDSTTILLGSEPLWNNSHSGSLTEFADRHPDAILLFDELEKAHPTVIMTFLQLLEGAVLTDKHSGKDVSFGDTVVIFTTNAGKQLYTDSEDKKLSVLPRNVILDALRSDKDSSGKPYFPPEICSRFARGDVIMFDHMTPATLEDIAARAAIERFSYYRGRFGLEISARHEVINSLVFRYSGADARTACGRAEAFFDREILELLSQGSARHGTESFCSGLKEICFTAELDSAPEDVKELFYDKYISNIVMMSDSAFVSDIEGYNFGSINVYFADTLEKALDLMKKTSPSTVIADLSCGKHKENKGLSIDDIDSEGRSFFDFVCENMPDIPVYIACTEFTGLHSAEKRALLARGAAGFINIEMTDFKKSLGVIRKNELKSYKLRAALKLASANKQLSFETRQQLSEDGAKADIVLYSFRLRPAVSAADRKAVTAGTSRPDIHFSDVIGAEDAKNELAYFVNYLKNPRQYLGMGVKQPRGVLLYGPPGTGKTMLAKACAGESDVTFISTDGTSLLDPNGRAVDALFRRALKYAPSIIFIDEIDIIGKRRGDPTAVYGADSVLNSLLTRMDGFKSSPGKPVFVLAATNYGVDPRLSGMCLDPALVRRFDRKIFVDLPSKADREKYISMLCERNKAFVLTGDFVKDIASRSEGMSLAELSNVMEFSLRNAIRMGSTLVTDTIFNNAFETCTEGETNRIDKASLERIAYHEAGHAVLSCACGKLPVYLTVTSRGSYGGYMMKDPEDCKAVMTKRDLFEEMVITMGGAAAEKVFFGEHSNGAAGDIEKATSIACDMIFRYGMLTEHSLASLDVLHKRGAAEYGDMSAAVDGILKRVMDCAVKAITDSSGKTRELAQYLIARGHMNRDDITELLSGGSDIARCEFSL